MGKSRIYMGKSRILTKITEYSRVIYQSIGNLMLIANNINTEVYSVLVRQIAFNRKQNR